MILLIDSYDSFSYNLYQLVGALNSLRMTWMSGFSAPTSW